ncbi:epidermal growth factor receptor kinase substrate 8 isoform X1 [Drosophila guanche]|uniref:Blast:Epidermal growth factor receptor kinase substrate 8 n=2 Tax=Drosophila guanche TaxID=7266 RepID=A0A3B0JS10_DROGU|nr:epidermal growth factor receptor kinase substrate 8 isoform X1 [Drosophila guanche]SPP83192.1 blast:Epidermal growth factor receptor kinase substrate 8 [Drosophila guanche]
MVKAGYRTLKYFRPISVTNGMPRNGYENGVPSKGLANGDYDEIKPTYALEHLATFKLKNEAETKQPKEKMKLLIELDKTGGIWPHKMFMSFNGQWLVMLDNEMREIENFPGSLITEPTAFVSEDPQEAYNNILIFSVPGISLGNTEMHIFQVADVSSVNLVEDLRTLSKGTPVTIDRNKTPIRLPKPERPGNQQPKDQYGIAAAVAGIAAEKNAMDREQTERDVQVINHCFEDIERFMARLHYAAEALNELKLRKDQHNPHGEGLLVLRSRPPIESEFHDILAKVKLALIYSVKLQNHFTKSTDPIHNVFISLQTIVTVCNDIYVDAKLPEGVVNPLLRRETIGFLSATLDSNEKHLWQSLGPNWTLPKDQFKDHKSSYHPIFYDDWSPDWVVDEEVQYLAPALKKTTTPSPIPLPPSPGGNRTWLSRLESRNVKIAEVAYNKSATNDKELKVTKGEYLEIIDDSRNWWKARNSYGSIGYVPNTVLTPYNFEHVGNSNDTVSLASMSLQENGEASEANHPLYRNTMALYSAPTDLEPQQPAGGVKVMPRSYSMPNVPVPPPMPPAGDSQPTTPSGTLKRNMAAAGALAAMRARNDCDAVDESFILQDDVNDELRVMLQQRQRRKDLEILKTPEIFITQHSKPKEVEEWLRGKGFSDNIVKRLHTLSGEEIFALSPHTIESYFGQRESRRLISQIVLQKNFCEYKTIRSSELSAKLARARQKADQSNGNLNEVF